MDGDLPIRDALLLAFLGILGTGVESSAVGQHSPSFVSPQAGTAADTSLLCHIHSIADLHDIRGGSATWDPRGTGALVFTTSGNTSYSWVDIPAAGDARNLRERSAVEASITNMGANPSEVQLWVVASHGWDSVADVATVAPDETRTFSCRLRELFPDGTPKLDPSRVIGVRMLVRQAAAGTVVRVAGLAATGQAPPWRQPADRVEVPAVEDAAPAPGRRVPYRLVGDEATDISCLLHLPEDWEPDRRSRGRGGFAAGPCSIQTIRRPPCGP